MSKRLISIEIDQKGAVATNIVDENLLKQVTGFKDDEVPFAKQETMKLCVLFTALSEVGADFAEKTGVPYSSVLENLLNQYTLICADTMRRRKGASEEEKEHIQKVCDKFARYLVIASANEDGNLAVGINQDVEQFVCGGRNSLKEENRLQVGIDILSGAISILAERLIGRGESEQSVIMHVMEAISNAIQVVVPGIEVATGVETFESADELPFFTDESSGNKGLIS